ncbi:MAG TPA: ribulose-phosphate 3-epimerase [Syntrophorhabdaceae bacterium]
MRNVRIAPSILSCDFSRLGREISDVEKAGADLIHVDVMDGHFVPNITIGPLIVRAVKKSATIPLDVHLMIEHPERYVADFIEGGADIVTIHAEADKHMLRTIDVIKSLGKKAGISLNPSTPEEEIKYVFDVIDMVLIMTVNPGFGGQKYMESMERKIRKIREMIDNSGRSIDLEVDGGLKAQNAYRAVEAGADILVMGTEIFQSGNYAEKMAQVRKAIEGKVER